MRQITAAPLTAEAFAPFGDVLELRAEPSFLINQGNCERHHHLAGIDTEGAAGVSLFHGQPYPLPLTLEMVERHPLGSQAFIPMNASPFLVIVAEDGEGTPDTPRAFITSGTQGVSYNRNTWHGVLTPLSAPQTFAVVDRCAPGENLQEHWFDTPYHVVLG
ncbi:MAG: ureidoglycolate lyase [Pseudomonadota bacterium]